MKLAVTGATGFLGWHVRCHAFALGIPTVPIDRSQLSDVDTLADALADADTVVHCAGATRGTDAEVTEGILEPARALAEAVRRVDHPVRLVYANSIHSTTDTVYGMAKRKAAELLAGSMGAPELSDVILPNLYGEHGRPYHNSFVATFCHQLARGEQPAVRDADIGLLHAQEAARTLIAEAAAAGHRRPRPAATPTSVREVLAALTDLATVYDAGELPDLADEFRRSLFNTYRSYLFPDRYPIYPQRHADTRGVLVECARTGGAGQAFVSSTEPGAVRGEHAHLRKLERFVVVAGAAEIALRRLGEQRVVRFQVDGDRPAIVDIPTMWAHKLTAISPTTTVFWSSERFRPDDADTYPVAVDVDRGGR